MRLCSASFGIADSEKKKEEEDEDEDEDEDEEEEEDDYRNLKKKIITRFDARGGEAAEKKNCLQFRCFSKFGRLLSNFFVLRLDGAPYGRGVAILLPYVFRYFSYIHSLHHRRPLILIMILTIASLLNRLIEL